MKKAKIVIIALIVVVILGAVFLKYVKPKLDARKEEKRLEEAKLLSLAATTKISNTATDVENIESALPTTEIPTVGGYTVTK